MLDSIRERLREYSQDHLSSHLEEGGRLAEQLGAVDLEEVRENYRKSQERVQREAIEPLGEEDWSGPGRSSAEEVEEFRGLGMAAIGRGEVAVGLLAGGQGTRLGVDYPKGMLRVGLPSGKSLFQVHAERILRLEAMGRGGIPWYIMTSDYTDGKTRAFFEENDYFGLRRERVFIFEQELYPTVDLEGRLLLDGGGLVMSPNGNGDFFRARRDRGLLGRMRAAGVLYMHVFSVDNILAKVGDPVFLGYTLARGAECGLKVVEREAEREALGSVCREGGRFAVVEYSEMTPRDSSARDTRGALLFRAGSICVHIFSTALMERLALSPLPYHVALKRVPHLHCPDPPAPNALKFEKFIFDSLRYARSLAVWQVPRHEEFAPIKNPHADSSPASARAAFLALSKHYFERHNPPFPGVIEVAPLASYWDEGLSHIGDLSGRDAVHITRDGEGNILIMDC